MSPELIIKIETSCEGKTNQETWSLDDGSITATIIYALIKGSGQLKETKVLED